MKIEIVTENGNLFPFAYEDGNVKKGKKISNLNKFYKEIKENVNSIEFKESSMENHSTAIPVCPGKILCPEKMMTPPIISITMERRNIILNKERYNSLDI